MAVPKKKTSKAKRNQRSATWKGKAAVAAQRAMSIGKSVLSGRAQGFVYPVSESEDGIRDRSPSRGLGDVYKRQHQGPG